MPFFRAHSSHLGNLYQRPLPNCKFDFSIPTSAQNNWEFARDNQHPIHNSGITNLNYVIVKPIQSTTNYYTEVVEYNGYFNLDKDHKNIEFVDINLPCNKQCLQLLANYFITSIIKKRIIEINNKDDKHPKPSYARKKKTYQAS